MQYCIGVNLPILSHQQEISIIDFWFDCKNIKPNHGRHLMGFQVAYTPFD